jgi:lipoprotein-releasing system permease protein
MYRWFIAYKYIASRLITLIALLAVTLSVAVLIVVVSIMEGFRSGLEERIRGSTSDIKIDSELPLGLEDPAKIQRPLEAIPGVRATAAVVETFALHARGGGFNDFGESEEYLLQALDFTDELSRRELEKSLRAVPVALDVRRLQNRALQQLVRELVATQPRTAEGLFSRKWLEEDLWKPWARIGREKPDVPLRPIVIGIESFRDERLLIAGLTIRLTSFSPDLSEPREETFLIAGFFKTGLYEIDRHSVVMRLEDAAEFLGLRDSDGHLRVSGIRVEVEVGYSDPESLTALRERVEKTLEENEVLLVKTQTWREARASLLDAVKVEKVIVSITLGAVILFAGLMIFIILTVQVVEKARDIGILQALGATARGIAATYFAVGSSLCLAGMVLGAFYGVAIALSANTILRWFRLLTGLELFPDDVYYLDGIPVKFRSGDLAFIIVTTVLASLLASLFPAIRAARREPTESLRYG